MTSLSPQLSDDIHAQIKDLCAAGDSFAETGALPDALDKYWAAWDLLPDPRTPWSAATWILAAIGDANFQGGDLAAGRVNLAMAMQCPSGW